MVYTEVNRECHGPETAFEEIETKRVAHFLEADFLARNNYRAFGDSVISA
jgi:hypothetical protein